MSRKDQIARLLHPPAPRAARFSSRFSSRFSFLFSSLLGALLLGLLACSQPASAAAPQKVQLLMGEALDEHGVPRPLQPQKRKLFDAIERELGIVFEIHMYPWARAELNAINGQGLAFGLPKTAQRLRALRYSDPAAANNVWLVTRSDATFTYNSLEDLRGKTVGAVRGFNYGEDFERGRGTIFRVDDDISSRATRLTRLMLKRIDVLVLYQPNSQSASEVEASVRAFMAERIKSIGSAANADFSVLPKPMATGSQLYFAIARERDHGMIDRINAVLARLRQKDNEERREDKRRSGLRAEPN